MERVVPSRRGGAQASVTEALLRREVWRDLEVLLNTIAMESTEIELVAHGDVRRSVINFGLPDITHRSLDELARNDRTVEREIETVLAHYEPRLVPHTIRVNRDPNASAVGLTLRYEIRADLICKPVDIPIEFMAEVEVDSGRVVVSPF